jgi:hypothetical protein
VTLHLLLQFPSPGLLDLIDALDVRRRLRSLTKTLGKASGSSRAVLEELESLLAVVGR